MLNAEMQIKMTLLAMLTEYEVTQQEDIIPMAQEMFDWVMDSAEKKTGEVSSFEIVN